MLHADLWLTTINKGPLFQHMEKEEINVVLKLQSNHVEVETKKIDFLNTYLFKRLNNAV